MQKNSVLEIPKISQNGIVNLNGFKIDQNGIKHSHARLAKTWFEVRKLSPWAWNLLKLQVLDAELLFRVTISHRVAAVAGFATCDWACVFSQRLKGRTSNLVTQHVGSGNAEVGSDGIAAQFPGKRCCVSKQVVQSRSAGAQCLGIGEEPYETSHW